MRVEEVVSGIAVGDKSGTAVASSGGVGVAPSSNPSAAADSDCSGVNSGTSFCANAAAGA